MSYEIMYDRRFIALKDGRFVPMVQQGSNNCFEHSTWGKLIPEKYWVVYRYCFPTKSQYAFTEDELKQMASIKGLEWFKTRYKKMTDDEFYKHFMAGVKSAQTIEEYREMKNGFSIEHKGKTTYIYTTEELKRIIDELEKNKDVTANFAFDVRDFFTKKRTINPVPSSEKPYVIYLKRLDAYFLKKTKYKLHHTRFLSTRTRRFKTEKEAQKYIEQNYGLEKLMPIVEKIS